MKHPTKAQVQTVIDTLTKSLSVIGSGLDMNNGTLCGTFLCHGGHYAIGKKLSDLGTLNGLHYKSGANAMAADLGFKDMHELELWADANPDLWGNKDGSKMFLYLEAFESDKKPYGAKDLNDIVDHWREVQGRLPE